MSKNVKKKRQRATKITKPEARTSVRFQKGGRSRQLNLVQKGTQQHQGGGKDRSQGPLLEVSKEKRKKKGRRDCVEILFHNWG